MGVGNWCAIGFGVCLLAAGQAAAQTTDVPPASYDAITDRGPRLEPSLPAIGGAGYGFVDPVFGTPIRRLTDGITRPGRPDRSYRTPSGTHQNAWSAGGSLFYVVSTDGTVVPFAFDAATGKASRIDPTP